MVSELLRNKPPRTVFHFVIEGDTKYKIARHFVHDQPDHHNAIFSTEYCVTLEYQVWSRTEL